MVSAMVGEGHPGSFLQPRVWHALLIIIPADCSLLDFVGFMDFIMAVAWWIADIILKVIW